MLKALFAICVLQTVVLLFLSSRFIRLEHDVEAFRADVAAIGQSQAPAAGPAERVVYANDPGAPSIEAIRSAFREEIAALTPPGTRPATEQQAQSAYSAAEAEQEYATIRREIEGYILRGDMSEAEMAAMQMRIGKLPPAERRRAMGLIIKAIDAGTLKARL